MRKAFLQNNRAFQWYKNEKLEVKGFLFGPDQILYKDEKLFNYFQDVNSFSDFEERVNYANGIFSAIIRDRNEIYAAVDQFRSLPLYYARHQGEWLISDDSSCLAEYTGFHKLNTLSESEFLATGYVTNDKTLLEGIRQIQAGECIHFKEEDLHRKFYFSYRVNNPFDDDYEILKSQAYDVIISAFQRFIAGLQGRKVVLPLSGGFDSRLIACLLKYFEYENVLCFTYGRKNNKELKYSSQVAARLGFEWTYIEYNDSLISNFVNDEDFRSYYGYAGGLTSMFYMQEYFAVKYLKENKMIPDDSVFTPGIFGDFLGGGMLYRLGNLNIDETTEQVARRIYFTRYIFKSPPKLQTASLLDKIEKSLHEKFKKESDLSYSFQEDWEFKERYAKFIVNSCSIYTWFGYEFRLPFSDMEIVNFFRKLPLHTKINKFLYDDLLSNEFFQKYELNFNEELQPGITVIRRAKFRSRIKKYLPERIKRLFINKKDDLFYREITSCLKDELAKKGIKIRLYGNSYNSLIVQWYIHTLKNDLQKFTKPKKKS